MTNANAPLLSKPIAEFASPQAYAAYVTSLYAEPVKKAKTPRAPVLKGKMLIKPMKKNNFEGTYLIRFGAAEFALTLHGGKLYAFRHLEQMSANFKLDATVITKFLASKKLTLVE